MIYTGFAEYLNSLQPIDKTFEYGKIDFFHRKDVTIDSILDKIFSIENARTEISKICSFFRSTGLVSDLEESEYLEL